MKKFVTILGAVLLTASTVQMASAGQRESTRKMERVNQGQQFRNSNAFYGSSANGFRDDGYRYSYDRVNSLYPGGAISAPAGR